MCVRANAVSEDSEEEEPNSKPTVRPDEYREEHLLLHKLSKQMMLAFGSEKRGPEKTALALGDLSGMALESELVQSAVREVGALEPLIKLLKAPDGKLRHKAATILVHLSHDPLNVVHVRRLGGIPFLLDALQDENPDTRLQAATIVCNISCNGTSCSHPVSQRAQATSSMDVWHNSEKPQGHHAQQRRPHPDPDAERGEGVPSAAGHGRSSGCAQCGPYVLPTEVCLPADARGLTRVNARDRVGVHQQRNRSAC